MNAQRTKNGKVAVVLVAVVAAMGGLSFAAVPLYQLFCQVTGYGGTPNLDVAEAPVQISDRVITVQFDANTNAELPWNFKPSQRQVTVRLGERKLAFYTAENLSGQTVTGTATFNVTPYKVGPYFSKIDCFCFTEQTLAPGQEVAMPVEFFVDPEIFNDPNTREVTTITLSYTFFRSGTDGDGAEQDKSATLDKANPGES